MHHSRRFFALVNVMNSQRNNMSLAGHTRNSFPSSNKVFIQPSVIEQEACFTIYMNNSNTSYWEVLCFGERHEQSKKQHVFGWAH